jgi:tryptophanyl-tRNA synthetase
MSQKPRFFTGLQPTGTFTLGNYLGVIKPILDLQEKGTHEIIIMIADLHALTVPKKEFNYRQKCYEMAALLYACGLKEDCKIFIQSEVKEHLELAFFLSPYVTVGKLGDMIQYKEKKKEQETGNSALLTYPVLMAADIFLYDADLVIVGQDQKQHLELAADIGQKFNNFYGLKLLEMPSFNIPELGAKIMSLQNPTKKMSKSENDYISLLDKPEIVAKKVKKAETDSENKIYYDLKKKPGISNLLTIYALLNNQEIKKAEKESKNFTYHQFKLKTIDLINEKLRKIQERYNYYLSKIKEILGKNKSYLQALAEKKVQTIKKVLKILEK